MRDGLISSTSSYHKYNYNGDRASWVEGYPGNHSQDVINSYEINLSIGGSDIYSSHSP